MAVSELYGDLGTLQAGADSPPIWAISIRVMTSSASTGKPCACRYAFQQISL
ncbi:hypothetical protein [Nonomuraea phyllanthi]|uniref:hypothetical protein n=1 Tax=Nonomuraea phyllanthi TaxID=2219224 RepID=UPI0012940ED5|nr:hypothetical protein [Nonomuraea phyllanthi]